MSRSVFRLGVAGGAAAALLVKCQHDCRQVLHGSYNSDGSPTVGTTPLQNVVQLMLKNLPLSAKPLLARALSDAGQASDPQQVGIFSRNLAWRALLRELHCRATRSSSKDRSSSDHNQALQARRLLSTYSLWFGPSGTVVNPEDIAIEGDDDDCGGTGSLQANLQALLGMLQAEEAQDGSPGLPSLADLVSPAHWTALAALASRKDEVDHTSAKARALVEQLMSRHGTDSIPAGLLPPFASAQSTLLASVVPSRWHMTPPFNHHTHPADDNRRNCPALLTVSPHIVAAYSLLAVEGLPFAVRQKILMAAAASSSADGDASGRPKSRAYRHAHDDLVSAATILAAAGSITESSSHDSAVSPSVVSALERKLSSLANSTMVDNNNCSSGSSDSVCIVEHTAALWPLRLHDRLQGLVEHMKERHSSSLLLPVVKAFVASRAAKKLLWDPYVQDFANTDSNREQIQRNRIPLLEGLVASRAATVVLSKLWQGAASNAITRDGNDEVAAHHLRALEPLLRVMRYTWSCRGTSPDSLFTTAASVALDRSLSSSASCAHGLMLGLADFRDASHTPSNGKAVPLHQRTLQALADCTGAIFAAPVSASPPHADTVKALDRLLYRPLAAAAPTGNDPSASSSWVEGRPTLPSAIAEGAFVVPAEAVNASATDASGATQTLVFTSSRGRHDAALANAEELAAYHVDCSSTLCRRWLAPAAVDPEAISHNANTPRFPGVTAEQHVT